jgi:P-type Ca2+ transporter type 2C
MLGMPEGMIPVQLLWVNLVTDGPPATALGFNPADPDVMLRPPRNPQEPLITTWVLIRYLVVGSYVGFATVGIFAAWYLLPSLFGIPITGDGHSLVTWQQLTHFDKCHQWSPEEFNPSPRFSVAGGGAVRWSHPCEYFEAGKIKASTLSLTVLVAIEMFNALNALSEDSSLLRVPPWCNPWLLVAMALSFGLHFLIMYVPVLASVFSIVPLTLDEWMLVMVFAAPVIFIDEALKQIGRCFVNPVRANHVSKDKHV